MKTQTNNGIILASIVALAIIVATLVILFGNVKTAHASNTNQTYLSFSMASTTNATVGTGSTLVLASSTDATQRYYTVITNDSNTSNAMYISFGLPAVVNKGIRLAPGQSITINVNNLFTGAIYAISTSTAQVADVETFQN